MATRATIAAKVGKDRYQIVYLHWDGYAEHAGAMLNAYYNTNETIEELFKHGDISELHAKIKDCKFYHRDLGEKFQFTFAASYYEALLNIGGKQDYNYLWNPNTKTWDY